MTLEDAKTFSFEKEKKRDKTPYSWQELNYLEQRRRAILKRVELPFWRVLLFWDGTCLRALARDWLVWFTLAIFTTIRLMAWFGDIPDFVGDLGSSDVAILGGFLSFFLVLFVNQTNLSFLDMYKTSMQCERFIFEVATVTTTMLPRPDALRLIRYMNAAHVAGYTGLSRTYTKASFFDELNKRFNFLSPKEMLRVEVLNMDHGGDCAREILVWCMMEVQLAQQKEYVDGRSASLLREKISGFQDKMDTLYAYNDQPVHFYYIHFLCLLSALYLPLFALTNAYSAGSAGSGDELHLTTDIVQGLIVLVQAIFVIGLRLLGQQMVDPYGKNFCSPRIIVEPKQIHSKPFVYPQVMIWKI